MTDMPGSTDLIAIRPAVVDDAADLARMGVNTVRVAHRGQLPDSYLDDPPLPQAYAESERNWRRALHVIAAAPTPRERVFPAAKFGLDRLTLGVDWQWRG